MSRRIGWFVFIALAGWLLIVSVMDLIPASRSANDSFRHLVENGVEKTAVVVGKREERISNYDGDFSYRFYVALEHTQGGKAFRREIPFQHVGLIRDAWERISVGDEISIRVLPDAPREFYAPGFLPSEALAAPTVDYWMYLLLAVSVVVLLGALLYFKVFRAPRDASRA